MLLQTIAPDIAVVATARDGRAALDIVTRLQPDVVLMEARLPRLDGVQATRLIRLKSPKTIVLILTTCNDETCARKAVEHGARGYLLKGIPTREIAALIRAASDDSVFISSGIALRAMHQGRGIERPGFAAPAIPESMTVLSRREREVLRCIAGGLCNGEIAERLYIGEPTVRNHVSSIYAKLGERRRSHLVVTARAWIARSSAARGSAPGGPSSTNEMGLGERPVEGTGFEELPVSSRRDELAVVDDEDRVH